MGIFGEIERMVGACIGGLQVAQEGIDGTELRQLDARRAAAGYDPLLSSSRGRDGGEAPQAVRDHMRRGRQRCFRPIGQRFLGKCQFLQADQARMPRFGGLDGSNERDLVLRSAPAFTSCPFASQIGIILKTSVDRSFVLEKPDEC